MAGVAAEAEVESEAEAEAESHSHGEDRAEVMLLVIEAAHSERAVRLMAVRS